MASTDLPVESYMCTQPTTLMARKKDVGPLEIRRVKLHSGCKAVDCSRERHPVLFLGQSNMGGCQNYGPFWIPILK